MAALPLLMLFACLATVALPTARATEGDQGCEDGWSKFGSRCFKFFEEKKSWVDAEKSCHALGANLPSIHSLAENNFIVKLIKTASGADTRTWLGGTDAAQEGQWLWSDGSPWDFTRWYPNQPDNAGGLEHFASYWGNDLWNDIPHSWTLDYICAKDAPQTSLQPGRLTLEGFACQCTPENKCICHLSSTPCF